MAGKPSRLVGDLQDAVELVTANALLSRAKQMRGLKPLVQGDMTALNTAPTRAVNCLTAVAALLQAEALDALWALQGS